MTLKKSFCFLSFLFFVFNLYAQNKKADTYVLYLKNGWVLRGKTLVQTDSTVAIITADGNRFVFEKHEMDSLQLSTILLNHEIPGFAHYTEIGALAATKNRPDNVTTAAFSFQTVNGYRFSSYLFAGAGIGIDLYATETYLPFFASVRGNLLRNAGFMPFYFVDGGYGWNITASIDNISYQGGLLMAGGIGFKRAFNERNGFCISAGYRLQQGAITINNVKDRFSNERIAIRAGFYF